MSTWFSRHTRRHSRRTFRSSGPESSTPMIRALATSAFDSSVWNPSSPGGRMNKHAESIPCRRRNRGEFRIVFSGPPPVPVTTRVCNTKGFRFVVISVCLVVPETFEVRCVRSAVRCANAGEGQKCRSSSSALLDQHSDVRRLRACCCGGVTPC